MAEWFKDNKTVKEYKLLEEKSLNNLLEHLNEHANEGWSIILSVQEYGVTKVILERDKRK